MQGLNVALLHQAMEEMIEFYRDDQGTLGEQFLSMLVLLERSETIPEEGKSIMRKRLKMFDQIWEESPIIQEICAGSEQKGEQKGKILTLQNMLIDVVESKYPELMDLARQQAVRIMEPDVLNILIKRLLRINDAETAQKLLEEQGDDGM